MRRSALFSLAAAAVATLVASPFAPAAGALRTASLQVASTPRPDLVVSSLGNPPADATMLASFTVAVATTNPGAAAAGASTTRLYLSHDNHWSTSDAALGDAHIPALRAHSSAYNVTAKATLPAFVTPGTYYLIACADAKHQVTEANETNNCRVAAHTVVFANVATQLLIERDRLAGRIDLGTSLLYRAWALFWDTRLAAKYDGTGSTGEDNALFTEIAAALPTLPAAERTALAGYISRPTDSASPFGPSSRAGTSGRLANAAATADTKCTAPNKWFSLDWPNDNTNKGFRVWKCAANADDAAPDINTVLGVAEKVWGAMTGPEPNGMGLPAPDTGPADDGGNGKIDVYILDTDQCRERNGKCRAISGSAVASTIASRPCNGVGPDHETKDDELPGYPAHACSAYMLMSQNRLGGNFTADFVHEFFHVLEDAHNWGAAYDWSTSSYHWYVEASASWAEWNYASTLGYSPTDAYDKFKDFQKDDESLLEAREGRGYDHQYESWVWPLFQTTEQGATNVFGSWSVIEGASNLTAIDSALDSKLSFKDHFRDFAVRNLQPYEYSPESTGLADSDWRTKPGLADFPVDAHHLTANHALQLGALKTTTIQQSASVKALAAQYDRYTITDANVREIKIDISKLTNVATADLDAVARLNPVQGGPADPWRRVQASGHILTLCRDNPNDDAKLLYVVVANHSFARVSNGPDANAAVHGSYSITLKNACDEPDHYDVTFSGYSATGDSWTGNATFDLIGAASTCDDPKSPPTSDSLHYCYGLKKGSAHWSYANHGGGTSATDVTIAPATDTGSVDLTIRDPNASKKNSYYSHFSPNPTMHILSTPDGSRDAAFTVIAWITTYSMPPGGFVHFGKGYQLSASTQLCGDGACQGWTWNFTPRWGT